MEILFGKALRAISCETYGIDPYVREKVIKPTVFDGSLIDSIKSFMIKNQISIPKEALAKPYGQTFLTIVIQQMHGDNPWVGCYGMPFTVEVQYKRNRDHDVIRAYLPSAGEMIELDKWVIA
jgi:hypothetical protein